MSAPASSPPTRSTPRPAATSTPSASIRGLPACEKETVMLVHRNVRRGITLTEVLVAIFVCGLGLMALMTLFPLGAMNMAQALKDDRCGHCAGNGAAILRAFWRCSLEGGSRIVDPADA